jgi:hypothetical protein
VILTVEIVVEKEAVMPVAALAVVVDINNK